MEALNKSELTYELYAELRLKLQLDYELKSTLRQPVTPAHYTGLDVPNPCNITLMYSLSAAARLDLV